MSEKSVSLWWPRYVGDYQRKTATLSLMEHGAYALLLDEYYSTGKPLPANASILQRVCRAFAGEEAAAVQSVIDKFFVLMPDGYHNEKADEELVKRSNIRQKRQEAAFESHKKRDANAGANAHTPTPTSTTTSIKNPPTPQGGDFINRKTKGVKNERRSKPTWENAARNLAEGFADEMRAAGMVGSDESANGNSLSPSMLDAEGVRQGT